MDHSESGVVRQKLGRRLPASVASRQPDDTSLVVAECSDTRKGDDIERHMEGVGGGQP
jgi:hypothetical protein